jgi:hypothetical protein
MNRTSALAKIRADIERHRHLFDLDRDELGKKLCKAATDGVQQCIAEEREPDGASWAPLSQKYEEWKSFQFPGQPIAVLYQHMADPKEVAGEVVVQANQAVVTYGVSALAKQEASFFQEGNAHQPPRRFWGFTKESTAEARALLDARFATA